MRVFTDKNTSHHDGQLSRNCVKLSYKKFPYQQTVMDPGHPPMGNREQLMFYLIDRSALNVAISRSNFTCLDTSGKVLLQNSKIKLINKRCAATLKIPDSMGLLSK